MLVSLLIIEVTHYDSYYQYEQKFDVFGMKLLYDLLRMWEFVLVPLEVVETG